jgi:uncharacterized membrane protein YccC
MDAAPTPVAIAAADAGFWPLAFGLLAAAAAVATAVGVWILIGHVRSLLALAGRLDALEELAGHTARLAADRDDIDLRRIEHVLIDLRDAQRRVEDAFLRNVEEGARARRDESAAIAGEHTLPERVTDRLHSLGYERVQLVSSPEELAAVVEAEPAEGTVLVEAYRQGVLHKGRVIVRDGRIVDQDLRSSHSIFP